MKFPRRNFAKLCRQFGLAFTLLGSALVWAGPTQETGVSASEIKLGMSNALSGPASGLGQGIKTGSQVFFNRLNASGGVHGRKITLISEDDGYEPTKAAAATEKLIRKDQVFALFGYVGTPTAKAAVPIAIKHQVPFFAPFTGAAFLRNPVEKWVFNVRPSYLAEARVQVGHLVKDAKIKKIAVFIQGDAFGLTGLDAVKQALSEHNLPLAAEGRYQRNSDNIDAALATLKAANPEAVIMVGAYTPCALLVKKARASGFNPKFLSLSFVGTRDFIEAAGLDAEDVLITQVMPSPDNTQLAIVRQYQLDMKAAGYKQLDYTSLEGYVNAAVFAEALKASGPDLTRKGFIEKLEKLKVNLGGLAVAFVGNQHQGLQQVYLTRVRGGKAVAVTKLQAP